MPQSIKQQHETLMRCACESREMHRSTDVSHLHLRRDSQRTGGRVQIAAEKLLVDQSVLEDPASV